MPSKQIRLDTDLIARTKVLFPELAEDEDKEFIEWVMRSLLTRVLIRSDSVAVTVAPAPAHTPITQQEPVVSTESAIVISAKSDEAESTDWDEDP